MRAARQYDHVLSIEIEKMEQILNNLTFMEQLTTNFRNPIVGKTQKSRYFFAKCETKTVNFQLGNLS